MGLALATAFFVLHGAMLVAGLVILAGAGVLVIRLAQVAAGSDLHLMDRESSYRAFFENAVEGAFRTTPDGHYMAANRALARIYGYESPAALMGSLTDIGAQLYIDPSRREAFGAQMNAEDRVENFVSEIRRGDGSTIWISENARAVRDAGGRLLCYEGMVEDVTAKFAAQQATLRALREAEEASRAKSVFLAAMSHELRTPLNAIIGFSEIIKDELLGPSSAVSYREYAADIHISGVRLLAIINDILDVSKLEAGQVVLSSDICNLAVLTEDAVESVCGLSGETRQVEVDIAPDLPLILGDAHRLQQCLVKLIANAFKFTQSGGRIAVAARLEADGTVAVTVADEGIGMEPAQVAMALRPFQQLDGSLARRFGGTGLGLSLTRALIELHGGTIAIDSAVGEGTVVTLRLPADRVERGTEMVLA